MPLDIAVELKEIDIIAFLFARGGLLSLGLYLS